MAVAEAKAATPRRPSSVRAMQEEGKSDEMGMERRAYDPANLMSLCSQCHKEIHDIMPRRHNKRLTKQQTKLLTSARVAAFARFLPQQEENNGNI